jgi:predicted transcriptional regulator
VLTPAGREILEVLWRQPRPMRTTDLHRAVAATFRQRAGRRLNSTSTLLTELMAQGWVTGTKHGARWRWEPSVTRSAGLRAIARQMVEEFCAGRADALYLVVEALDGLDLEALVESGGRQAVRASGFGPGPGGRRPRRR